MTTGSVAKQLTLSGHTSRLGNLFKTSISINSDGSFFFNMLLDET